MANTSQFGWGIMGTGTIAALFTEGLQTLPQAQLAAVGSRSLAKASEFAKRWSVSNAHGNYADLLQDPDVDIIYVATPHSHHYEHVRDALLAGKHVLCEKPFTINASQARELIAMAQEKQLFLMDAMWNRFQPWAAVVMSLIGEGKIGDLYHLKADLSFAFPFDPAHRLFNPALGGGALLDLGVYPVALASFLLGNPSGIQAKGHLCETGVDDQVSMLFTYKSGAMAELGCASRFTTKNNATLHGSKGWLEIHGMIIRPQKVTLYENGKDPVVIETATESNGYQYEAQAVMDMIEEGKLEHPVMPLAETLEIMKTLDMIRDQIGMKYPGE